MLVTAVFALLASSCISPSLYRARLHLSYNFAAYGDVAKLIYFKRCFQIIVGSGTW